MSISSYERTALLKAVRYCKHRWKLNRESRNIPVNNFSTLKKLFFQFKFISYAPIFIPFGTTVYFDEAGGASSKVGIATKEIRAAFISKDTIYSPTINARLNKLRKICAFFLRLPYYLGVWLYVVRRAPRFGNDFEAMAVLLGRLSYIKLLMRRPAARPVLISDIAPSRYMLGSASSVIGQGVIWWQDDYHHIAAPDFLLHSAVVLNDSGALNLLKKHPSCRLYARESRTVRCLRGSLRNGSLSIGVAVNGYFEGSDSQIRLLQCLSDRLNGMLELRLHPTAKLDVSLFDNRERLILAPSEEPLLDFIYRMDLIIVGNTALQIHALREGVFVVHLPGLDTQGYDAYGYVSSGIVYGTKCVNDVSISVIDEFYKNDSYRIKLKEIMTLSTLPEVEPLAQMESNLS